MLRASKAECRSYYTNLRKKLSKAELERINEHLYSQFIKHIDLSGVKVIHIFLPIVENGEPDTWRIIHFLQKNYPHIQIAVPKTVVSSFSMTHFLLNDGIVLKKNLWNILEPVQGTQIQEKDIDMVLTPLLVADKRGFRVGYGKGFYDRFLAECRLDCRAVGLSQFHLIDEITDVDKYDIPLSSCITQNGITYW